ncbi:MAG: hypothetical protein ACRD5W_17210 [Candidatus Acidiferrales bacterium]
MAELRDLRIVPQAAPERLASPATDARQETIVEAQKAIQIIAEQVTRLAQSPTSSAEMIQIMKESAATLAQTVPVYTEAVGALCRREQKLENATVRLQESVARFQTQQMEMASQVSGTVSRLRSWLMVALLLAAFAVAAAAGNVVLVLQNAR